MKLFILFMTVMMGLSAFAQQEGLSSKQKQNVLEAVNNACGDSWCEGYYEFDFISYKCMKKSNFCMLNFVASPDGFAQTTLSGTCLISPKFKDYWSMVDKSYVESGFGMWPTLPFYERVTECVSDWEDYVESHDDLDDEKPFEL